MGPIQDVEELWAGQHLQKETGWYLKKWDSDRGSHTHTHTHTHTHLHTAKHKYFNDFRFLWSTLEFTPKPFVFVVVQIVFRFLLPPTAYSWFPEFGWIR